MTALVTAAAGFIGSHLQSALPDAGAPVVALDHLGLRRDTRAGRYAIYNLGSGAPRSVNELIAIAQAAAASSVTVETAPGPSGDVPLTYADTSAVRRGLGFAPRMTREAGVARYFNGLTEQTG